MMNATQPGSGESLTRNEKIEELPDESSSEEPAFRKDINDVGASKWVLAAMPTRSNSGDSQDRADMHKATWRSLVFDDSMRKPGTPDCRMIHPRSYFSQSVLAVSTCALSYTAAVVPVVIAFEWNKANECEWGRLLTLDLCIDSFFIFDVLLSFFMAECDKKGNINDNWREVLWKYVTGVFWFDLVTALPVSYAEVYVYHQCQSSSEDAELDPSKWRFARLIKPLKFVRILRVYRAFSTIDVAYRLEKLLHVQPIAFSLFRVVLGIFAITHVASCSFWLVKVLSNSAEDLAEFLESQGLSEDAPTLQQYVLCCYFVVTIFTTVGFGDMSATNTSEQVACMLLMMTGAMVFGTLLAEVQSGVSELRKLVREKGHVIQELKNFMRGHTVPAEAEKRILDWAAFEVSVCQQRRMLETSMERLTKDQRLELFVHMFAQASADIDLLNLQHHAAPEMHAHLWAAAEIVVFEEGKVMVQPGQPLNAMLAIADGHVRVEDLDGNRVVDLSKGDAVGVWALMGDTDASSPFGFPVVFVAASHVQLFRISREVFEEVLSICPEDLVQEVHAKWARIQRSKEQAEMLATDTRGFRRAAARWAAMVDKAVRSRRHGAQKSAVARQERSASHLRAACLKNSAFGHSFARLATADAPHPSDDAPANGLAGLTHLFTPGLAFSLAPASPLTPADRVTTSDKEAEAAADAAALLMLGEVNSEEGEQGAQRGRLWSVESEEGTAQRSGGAGSGGAEAAGRGVVCQEASGAAPELLSRLASLNPAGEQPERGAQKTAEAARAPQDAAEGEQEAAMDALVYFGFVPPPAPPHQKRPKEGAGAVTGAVRAASAAPAPTVRFQPDDAFASLSSKQPCLPEASPPPSLLQHPARPPPLEPAAAPEAPGRTSPRWGRAGPAAVEDGLLVKNVARLESRVTAIDGNVEQLQDDVAKLTEMVATVLKVVGGERQCSLLGGTGLPPTHHGFVGINTEARPDSIHRSLRTDLASCSGAKHVSLGQHRPLGSSGLSPSHASHRAGSPPRAQHSSVPGALGARALPPRGLWAGGSGAEPGEGGALGKVVHRLRGHREKRHLSLSHRASSPLRHRAKSEPLDGSADEHSPRQGTGRDHGTEQDSAIMP